MELDSGFDVHNLDSAGTSFSSVLWNEFSLVSPGDVDRPVGEVRPLAPLVDP